MRISNRRGIHAFVAQGVNQGIAVAVQRKNARGAGLADGPQYAGPVGMVGEDEAAIEAVPPTGSANAQMP